MEGIVVMLVVMWIVRLIAKLVGGPVRQMGNSMKSGMQSLRDVLTEDPKAYQQSVFAPSPEGKMSMTSFYESAQSAKPSTRQEPQKARTDDYEMSGMHVYERVQNRMKALERRPNEHASPEGKDPCHDDMAAMKYEDGTAYVKPTNKAYTPFVLPRLTKDSMVQAVVMSEILTRPRERGRRRHG